MHHIFIHSSADEHLGCFCVLAVINIAAVNIEVHVAFQIMFFLGYMPRSGFAGSYVSFVFSLLLFFFSNAASMLFFIMNHF